MSNQQAAANNNNQPAQQEKKEEKKEIIMVNINPSEFDLEAYINNYSGHTKIARLLFIAEHCKALETDALKMAIEELKKSNNSTLYKQIMEKVASDKLGAFDQAWMDAVDKKAAQQQERLEMELNGYKTNLIKESIRMGHNDLGDFYYNRGDLNSALKCYVRTRDYCTTSRHIIQMCMNVIKVSIEMGNYAHVVNYVAKAEQTPDLTDKTTISRLRVCAGLANLENRKYKMAARKFLETTIDIGESFNDVVAATDVAIYGGLTALATFDRPELKKKVLDDLQFRNFLELAPEVREIINDFYESKYSTCFKALNKIKNNLLLDVHLHEHVEGLYQKIRNKALVQYFSPFLSVDMATMATAFNTDVQGLEKELSRLIMEGSIQARIDSHNKRLYARQTDQRGTTFEKTVSMGDEYQMNTKALLLRVNMLRNDFVVKPPRPQEKNKA
jgi:COP9 signalosome complex subunit 1